MVEATHTHMIGKSHSFHFLDDRAVVGCVDNQSKPLLIMMSTLLDGDDISHYINLCSRQKKQKKQKKTKKLSGKVGMTRE
jgi:hypothetical protein